jgi:hypothetical protein
MEVVVELVGVAVAVLEEVMVEKGVPLLLAVLLPVAVVLPEREGVGVHDTVAVLVPLGVCVAGGDADAVADKLPVRLCVSVWLPVGLPVGLCVGVREPDTVAVEDKLAVAVVVPVAVLLLEAPTEPVLVIELVRLPVELPVVVPVGVHVGELVLVAVGVAEPVLEELRVAVMDGCRMHRLTLVTASASCADGRTPMVMVCTPLFSKTRERVIQPVPPPSAMSAAEAFHST